MTPKEIVIRNVRFKEVLESQRLRKRLGNRGFKETEKEEEGFVEEQKLEVELPTPKKAERKKKNVEKFYQPQLDKNSVKIVDRKRERALEILWAKLPPKHNLEIKIIDFSRYFLMDDIELGKIEREFLCVGYNYFKGISIKMENVISENSVSANYTCTNPNKNNSNENNLNEKSLNTRQNSSNQSISKSNQKPNRSKTNDTKDNNVDDDIATLMSLVMGDGAQYDEQNFTKAFMSIFVNPDVVVSLDETKNSPLSIMMHERKFKSSYKHILRSDFAKSAVNNYRNLVICNVSGMTENVNNSSVANKFGEITISMKPTSNYRKVEHKKGNFYHFEDQIRQFATNRYNRQVLKSEKDKLMFDRELDGCTFKPKINPVPYYLKIKRQEKLSTPLRFIKDYAMKFTEDKRAEKVIESLEHCTFQPNLAKHIEEEWKLYLERKNKREDNDGTIEGMINKAYDILDHPFENLYQSELDWWLENYKDSYASETCPKNPNLEKHLIWKKEMRDPLYSGSYSVYHSNIRRTVDPPTQNLNKGGSNHWSRWKESLRGGYLKDSFDHSGIVDNGPINDKTTRYQARDWGKYIRLKSRNQSSRILPNKDIIDSVCLQSQEHEMNPLPTVWDHRAPLDPKFYSQSVLKNKAGKITTFLVPTPIKQQNLLHSHRLHNELKDACKAKSVLIPPKVVGVKRDRLRDLEEEIKQPPPHLLLEELLYEKSEDN